MFPHTADICIVGKRTDVDTGLKQEYLQGGVLFKALCAYFTKLIGQTYCCCSADLAQLYIV